MKDAAPDKVASLRRRERRDVRVDAASVMRRDLFRLRQMAGRNADEFAALLERSRSELAQRLSASPHIEFPDALPISAHSAEIARLIQNHQVIIVAGETGSGKTTQLPKICLQAGLGRRAMIGHTQPRRLAARAVATRIAEELQVSMGEEVGYAVRFSDQTGPRTLVKLITDGLLLTEIRRDRLLENYDVIIVDEAHERSLNIDFLLGYLKQIMARRRDLKIIITSATIDVAAFSRHFDDAPVVEVGGRGYPVATRYVDDERSPEERLVACLEEIDGGALGPARDVLVFQSGEREILETARLLRGQLGDRLDILPLYARLSQRDQQRVFHPGRRRRVVLATNVAETSITVPNIGYVIDPGLARISRYSFRSKLQRLPIEPISQASANQRMGRCGRIAPGTCFRLYSEADYLGRQEFTDPEIKRTNLASVVLQMQAFGLGDVARFPFLDPPDPRAVRDAERLLHELGALGHGALTKIGHVMARLPVDPRLARMLIAADEKRSLREVLIIVSALAIADPRERPLDRQGSADRAHEAFADQRSDYLSFVNLWKWAEKVREEASRAALRRELEKRFLSPARMREWRELHRQLLLACRELGMRPNPEEADFASIHQALLTGSLSFIGQHDEKGDYLGPRNLRFRIFPGSGLAARRPPWVMAGEISETRRVYARCVAAVEPRWIEAAAPHLLKRRHSEPHWSARRGEAEAYETVTLYGLRLAEKRRVSYAAIDPAHSRDLMIREGLLTGAVPRSLLFVDHNLGLLRILQDREARGRRRDLLVSEDIQAALYDERLPPELHTWLQVEKWWRAASAAARDALFFTEADLTTRPDISYGEAEYPAQLVLGDAVCDLKYRFAPGETDDGVSVEVPLGMLGAVVAEALEWSVPGFFPAVCEQWLRSLPKTKRRHLAPLPEKVEALLPLLTREGRYRHGKLTAALARALVDLFGLQVDATDWDPSRIDSHLLINIRVMGPDGTLLAQGRDLKALQARFADQVQQRLQQGLPAELERSALTRFPEDIELSGATVLEDTGGQVVVYPSLVDAGDHVDLKLLGSPEEQRDANRCGYPRLALLHMGQEARRLRKRIERERELGLYFAALGPARLLCDEVLRGVAWYCFFEDRPLPQSAESFAQRIAQEKPRAAVVFDEVLEIVRRILRKRFEIVRQLDAMTSPAFAAALEDVRSQLQRLVPADLLTVTPRARLNDIPRYLDGVRYRLEHLQGKVRKDQELTAVVRAFEQRLDRLRARSREQDSRWQQLRFGVEELRLGLFAEPMGTRGKVSTKRLDADFLDRERELGLV